MYICMYMIGCSLSIGSTDFEFLPSEGKKGNAASEEGEGKAGPGWIRQTTHLHICPPRCRQARCLCQEARRMLCCTAGHCGS